MVGMLINCLLRSWRWRGYLRNSCYSYAGSCMVKGHPSELFGEVRACCEHGETESLKSGTLALGLRSVNQLPGLFLSSPTPSYFMVLACPPSPLKSLIPTLFPCQHNFAICFCPPGGEGSFSLLLRQCAFCLNLLQPGFFFCKHLIKFEEDDVTMATLRILLM